MYVTLATILAVIAAPTTTDPNFWAFLTVVVTSLTTIVLAVINWLKSRSIEKKVDAGNVVSSETRSIANGRTESLMRQLEEKNQKIHELSLLLPVPPPDSAAKL